MLLNINNGYFSFTKYEDIKVIMEELDINNIDEDDIEINGYEVIVSGYAKVTIIMDDDIEDVKDIKNNNIETIEIEI